MALKALTVLLSLALASPGPYEQAVKLYGDGMYERALAIFESLDDSPLTDGYELLCLIKLDRSGAGALADAYDARYVRTALSDQIDYEWGSRLFDARNYRAAATRLERLSRAGLHSDQVAPYVFRLGYCAFANEDFAAARERFAELETMPYSRYHSPARYSMGFMDYKDKEFRKAIPWLESAAKDPRFTVLSEGYLLECRFMLGDYDYVTEHGEELYGKVPEDRRSHLARIISESYLVKDDRDKAHEFFELSHTDYMSRTDYFYAGTVLYGVEDYEGAIAHYSRMDNRTDSLGQIANYHLGKSYLELRNRVASLESFKAAAAVSYDPEIQEDAWFNFAKMAFDLNEDASGFESYIAKYSTTRRGEQIYGYMALSSLIRRDYAAAVAAYDEMDELDESMKSNYVKANYLRATQLVANGAYTDAIPCLRAVSFYLPKGDRFNQLSRYWLAECLYRTGNYKEAEKLFTELYNSDALDSRPEGRSLAYNVAYCQMSQDKQDAAARWLDIYLGSGDKTFRQDALRRRADCDFARKLYKEAVSSYEKLIAEYNNPDDMYPWYRQGVSAGLGGDKYAKAAILSRVETASPTAAMYQETLYELGRAYMDIGKSSHAIKAFTRLKDGASDPVFRARALIGLGMVYRNDKRYDEALDAYKEVVSSMRGTEYAEDALSAVQSIYQKMGQPQKYLAYMEENRLAVQRSEREKEDMYFAAAEQLYAAGSLEEGLASAQKYLGMYPEGVHAGDAWFFVAEALKDAGDKEQACEAYSKSIASASGGSYYEPSLLSFASLSMDLEHFGEAYRAYSTLRDSTRFDINVQKADLGMMLSAYAGHEYDKAIEASGRIDSRQARYIKAKSLFATSRRTEAMLIFASLKGEPSTPEGAEACYMLIRDMFDRADFLAVEDAVFDFSQKAGDQMYWLARAFIVLGDSFVEEGKTEQAKVTFQSILDGYEPQEGDDIVETVKQRLEKL